MRIFVWHGYLLGGTGSNIYARQLTREWSREGHDVTVFSQEPEPERFDLGGAATIRPDVGGLLPVFMLDRYEGYEVRRVQDCSRAQLDAWVEANAAALRAEGTADFVFVNHVLLGGPVGAACGGRYVVKAHGSELEYSMRGNAALSAWGGEVLDGAVATIVGSGHIRGVVRDVCGTVERVHEIPPGVDVELWRPAPRDEALDRLIAEARLDPPNPGNVNERLPDEGNAERLAAFLDGERDTVVYYGKLIENKGVQVLLEAMRGLDARAVIVGFGDYRAQLEAQATGLDALFTGPLEHRHLGPSARAGRRGRRAVDLPRGVRDGRGRGGRRRLPSGRREPLGPGRDRARAGGGVPARAARARQLPERRRRRAARAAGGRARAPRGGAGGAPGRGPPGRRRALELDERRPAHQRRRRPDRCVGAGARDPGRAPSSRRSSARSRASGAWCSLPLGVAVVAEAEGQSDEAGIGAGVGLIFLGAFAFAIAYGAFRVKRWAWVAFMTWAAVGLATNLLRVFFFPAEPHYESLAISALTVFLLTPLEVQVAFGVRTLRLATLDTTSRNPIDGV